MSTRVLIADDQALVRAGFRKLLESAGVEVVGEAADGREAIDEARRLRPSLVVMDIRMPRIDGGDLTADGDGVRVLILTMFGLDDYVYKALWAGASGFMLKDSPPEERLAAIEVVARGDALIAPAVTRCSSCSRAGSLTPRGSWSAAAPSRRMSRTCSPSSLRDRVQAVILAYEAGVITPGR
jgi:DNA-binding NarL/FixJ family response regulator